MKRIYFILFTGLLVACGESGLLKEENKVNHESTPLENGPAVKDTVPAKIDSGEIKKVNFDTAFNFAERKTEKIITTSSGIKIEFIEHGTGPKIKKGDVVAINYQGKLGNGKVFESNRFAEKAVPYYVGIEMTLKAWDEVLTKCSAGDKIKFMVPAKMAYGKDGRGNLIPPDSDLYYEMDIVELMKPEVSKSGLKMYTIIENDEAPVPKKGDNVALGYMGWLKTGKLFDASIFNKKDYEFKLHEGAAIEGWHEAVSKMHLKEKVLIEVPAKIGYGNRGIPELVPPGATLVYILELKSIN